MDEICDHIRLIWAIAATSSKDYSGKHLRLWRRYKNDEADVYETKYCPECGQKLIK